MSPQLVETITVFVDDPFRARSFYEDVLEATVVYEDDACLVVKLGSLQLNLLNVEQAHELVGERTVGAAHGAVGFVFTVVVDDVDEVAGAFVGTGVRQLTPPTDKPWGRRVSTFADPCGILWELAQEL